MCKISEGICLLIMLYISVRDMQIHKVAAGVLALAGLGSVLYQLIIGKTDYWLVLCGGLVGVVFILISKVTGEEIGYGDSIGIMILGIFLGLWRILTVLSMAFFLLLCVSIPVMWKKRMSRKLSFPFYPFLTGGYLCLLLMEGMT